MYKCNLNAKYNNASICGECVLFSFFSSSVSTGSVLFVCCFVSKLSLCSLTGFFPGIILNKCEQILFLLGFSVFNAVDDAIILHWHLLHSSLSGGNKFLGLYTGKKFCVREMAVEVGSSLVVLGATWGTLEFIPTIEMKQLFPFYWVCC